MKDGALTQASIKTSNDKNTPACPPVLTNKARGVDLEALAKDVENKYNKQLSKEMLAYIIFRASEESVDAVVTPSTVTKKVRGGWPCS